MLEYWYAALQSKYGIVLRTDNVINLKQKLYSIRKEIGDPDLMKVSIIQSPTSTDELWLVKNGKA